MTEPRGKYADMMVKVLSGEYSLGEVKKNLSDDERNFFNMLLMTTFRRLAFIKQNVFPCFVKKKIPQKQRILEFILYLAITEILFLDTPDYAVLNSYVNVAKQKTDKFGANFVNAVLRNVVSRKKELLETADDIYFSQEFLKILKQDYTDRQIKEMEHFASIEPPLDITLKRGKNLEIGAILLPQGTLRLPANTKVKELSGYDDGLWWVQDAASSIGAKCFSDIKGKKVLDLCAAPGGKTAQFLDAGAEVTAIDISSKRLDILKKNIDRIGLAQNLKVVCCDVLGFDTDEKFDIVLADVPCSATGTFRRHPEIIHTKTLTDVQKQSALQKRILEKSSSFVDDGGFLIYSTCSLSKAEGEEQIKNFLSSNSKYKIFPIKLDGTKKMQTEEGFLRVLPQHFAEFGGIDGFFIAILQRKI